MELRRISLAALNQAERLRFLEIDKGILKIHPAPNRLFCDMERYDCYGYYDGASLVGFLMMNPQCPYFGGSVSIEKLRYAWEYNDPSLIADMLRRVVAQYQGKIVCIDCDRRHDVNRELYQKIGFSDSVMVSPIGKDHVVMIAEQVEVMK